MSTSTCIRFLFFLGVLQVSFLHTPTPVLPNLTYILHPYAFSAETEPVLQIEEAILGVVFCEAPYPIQWNFQGFVFPPEMFIFYPPERNLITKMFYLNIPFSSVQPYSDQLEVSIRISCEMTGHPEVGQSFSFFVRGRLPNAFITPKSFDVTDSSLIPCPIKDSTLTPLLYRKNTSTGNDELVIDPDLVYNPIYGFTSPQYFNGVYTCRTNTSSLTITAVATPTFPTYEFSPLSLSIRVYTDSSIQLQCLSKSSNAQPIHLTFHNVSEFLNISQSDLSSRQVATVSFHPDPLIPDRWYPRITATAKCWTGTEENSTVIHKWSLELVPRLTLVLDNNDGYAKCFSDSPGMMQILECDNPLECTFMSRCLDNVTHCNLRNQRQIWKTKGDYCDTGGRQKKCIQMPTTESSGLIQCSSRGLFRRWEFFTTLDYRKIFNWREAPKSGLVRMDQVSSILYANKSNQFNCTVVRYLFSQCYFELELRNGTKIILDSLKFMEGEEEYDEEEDDDEENEDRKLGTEDEHGLNFSFSEPEEENSREITLTVDIWLPLEAISMSCLAPWWNSTEVLRATRTFQTRHLLAPRLKGEPGVTRGRGYKKETFYIGQVSRRLACHVVGEPEVKYEWHFEGTKAELKFPELKTSSGASGESYLEFPMIEKSSKKFSGEWTCIGNNILGSAEQKFKLNVEDEPIPGKPWAYISVGAMILVVLLVVIFVLAKRYRHAKEQLRNLTDTEVGEFFKGKPELLAENGKEIEGSLVEFLPYKDEYEIPMEDLEFETSEKNILGSGFFSYVVRGKIISSDKSVAVKISKPTADVTLFKSLLSEVKIMIYIGEHENVVNLIGVCTQDIKNRCIYIVTDICDFGSLIGFLRKSRASFVNLINTNQEIDCELLASKNEDSGFLNTLDLISFCQQIASGMEYLAFKSIIHADLAARNVLLTSEKVCKISDFGLSKKLYESSYYKKKPGTPLPWRWMAIESLKTLTFSTSSDVWAYGVTLFEIFSLGDIPFPNETWNKEFLNRLNSGMRMGRPEYASQEIYAKVMACWEGNPEIRPEFSTLRVYFRQLYLKLVDSYQENAENTYIANTGPCI